MLMLKALRARALRLLWAGQALSAIGDEVYRVSLIWLAVGLIGADAGYLAAAQSASLFVLCLLGGHWADRWDHRRTMIAVDLSRGAIVLLPVAAFYFGRVTVPILFLVAVLVSGLGAFFDPALQAVLPAASPDGETLEAATGLMGTTVRLARAVGPAIVAVLGPCVPMIHFFTLDALSFGVSASSVAALPGRAVERAARPRRSLRDSLAAGFREVSQSGLMRDVMLVRMMVAALWGVAFSLGLALLVADIAPGRVRAFGVVVACYGIGNVLGALGVGNMRRERLPRILFAGYAWMGAGFAAAGLCRSVPAVGAACLLGAIGGPVNDVPFFDLCQRLFPIDDLPRVMRLRMALETGALMLVTAASPVVFRVFGAGPTICACGLGMAALGLGGLWAHGQTVFLTSLVNYDILTRSPENDSI